ncbi:MAG: YpmA family protein [Desulfotomaculum sp.]|nr:YpmA family protein [Desulfotomaculum sp.]
MSDGEKREPKLELIAHKSFSYYSDMYKVVDFLNKTLKDKKLIFGLTKDKDKMTINIYET